MKIFDNGGKVCKFSLATSEKYTNKVGEKVENTDWHNCVFNGDACDVITKYVHKGDQFSVTGKIKYRDYEKDGRKQYFTEIICSGFEFIGSAKDKPANNEGKPQKGGKITVTSKSDINELPGHINSGDVPDDDSPF